MQNVFLICLCLWWPVEKKHKQTLNTCFKNGDTLFGKREWERQQLRRMLKITLRECHLRECLLSGRTKDLLAKRMFMSEGKHNLMMVFVSWYGILRIILQGNFNLLCLIASNYWQGLFPEDFHAHTADRTFPNSEQGLLFVLEIIQRQLKRIQVKVEY